MRFHLFGYKQQAASGPGTGAQQPVQRQYRPEYRRKINPQAGFQFLVERQKTCQLVQRSTVGQISYPFIQAGILSGGPWIIGPQVSQELFQCGGAVCSKAERLKSHGDQFGAVFPGKRSAEKAHPGVLVPGVRR